MVVVVIIAVFLVAILFASLKSGRDYDDEMERLYQEKFGKEVGVTMQPQEYKALAVSELMEMTGEPVSLNGYRTIIDFVDTEGGVLITCEGQRFKLSDLGETWFAYRSRPSAEIDWGKPQGDEVW